MKLKNKKTGEIVDLVKGYIKDSYYGQKIEIKPLAISNKEGYMYHSLAELNEEWEDAPEEPKEYWAIDCFSPDGELISQFDKCSERIIENRKQIGNYFGTKEEAEEAVEKLKAMARLNKCGFRFEGYNDRDRASGGDIVIYAHVDTPNNNLLEEAQPAMLKDLDLLFGGEE